jgi:hypothetical protein
MSFEELRKEFLKVAGSKSVYNDPLNSGMFLNLSGALCHKRGLMVDRYGLKDLRIHALFIQDTRTGKGESLKVLGKAAELCGLRYTDEVVFTDAGLIGQVNPSIAQNNRKKGLVKGDPDYQSPITVGDLGIYDIISFSEGKQMIKTDAYSADKLEILQTAMDTNNIIKKKLAEEYPILIQCNATIIGTTYFLEDFERIFLEQGIFQRMLVFVRDYDDKDRAKLDYELIMGDPAIKTINFDNELKKFCNKLMKTVNGIPAGTRLKFTQKGKEALDRKNKQMRQLINNDFRGNELKLMSSFTTASINHYSKIGGVIAVLNEKDEIGPQEIAIADRYYIKDYMASLMRDIVMKVSDIDDAVVRRSILHTLKTDTTMKGGVVVKGLSRYEIVNLIQSRLPDISEPRVAKILNTMVRDRMIAIGPVEGKDGTIVQKYAKFER